MKDYFENLDSVEEMLDYIAENAEGERMKTNDIAAELQILQIQAFLKLFGICSQFTDEQKIKLEQNTAAYNDVENNVLVRQSALANVCELFFSEVTNKSTKEIIRKNDKVFQTPCEDCQNNPTHLVQFRQKNRVEEHFLCEDCEEASKVEDEDS